MRRDSLCQFATLRTWRFWRKPQTVVPTMNTCADSPACPSSYVRSPKRACERDQRNSKHPKRDGYFPAEGKLAARKPPLEVARSRNRVEPSVRSIRMGCVAIANHYQASNGLHADTRQVFPSDRPPTSRHQRREYHARERSEPPPRVRTFHRSC